MNFGSVIDQIMLRERGYVDHPSDRGGPTRWGITEAVARKNGWHGPMSELPETMARAIYLARYISEPRFDMVHLIDVAVGSELIDTGVNMGPGRASIFFQEWLNAFNKGGSHYADVFVDGRIGPVTLDAFRAYRRRRGAEGAAVMVAALNCSQGARYLDLTQNDHKQEDFIYGWIKERVLRPATDV